MAWNLACGCTGVARAPCAALSMPLSPGLQPAQMPSQEQARQEGRMGCGAWSLLLDCRRSLPCPMGVLTGLPPSGPCARLVVEETGTVSSPGRARAPPVAHPSVLHRHFQREKAAQQETDSRCLSLLAAGGFQPGAGKIPVTPCRHGSWLTSLRCVGMVCGLGWWQHAPGRLRLSCSLGSPAC